MVRLRSSLGSSRAPRARARSAALAAAALVPAAFATAAPRAAAAQRAAMLQGVADAELWKTDSGSLLLTRNRGRPGALGRVNLWGAVELTPGLLLYAAGTVEGGPARSESGTEWYTDLAGLRYTRSSALVIDAGKIAPPVGAFASRRYSMRNPLIGTPDGYPVAYPLGVQLSGARGRADYRAALVSLPLYHEGYAPEPTAAPRPALGAGFTPTTGVRVGASATWGPYLNDDLPAAQLAGRPWRAYAQRVGAVDAEVSRGYLVLRGELAASSYDVPDDPQGPARTVHGLTNYAEAQYTLAPRVFVAGRLERNDYPFIQPVADAPWVAASTNVYNAELGAGYRLGSQTLLKASVRADRWRVPPALRAYLPDGTALALQCSRTFDVIGATLGRRR